MSDDPLSDELLTTREVQSFLRISHSSLIRLVNDGRLHPIALGCHSFRFPRSDLESFLASSRVNRGSAPVDKEEK